MTKTIIVIPSRLASTRLPNKPLAEINGKPMIVRVMEQAQQAELGPVIIACCGPEIAETVRAAGGIAIETDPHLPSGSDRIVDALRQYDPARNYDTVINLQGDLPVIAPELIKASLAPLADSTVDIATLCCEIHDEFEVANPNVVKIATSHWVNQGGVAISRGIYFSRLGIPANARIHYHHIGIYTYRRTALEKFVTLPESYLETTEKLEQLRALEAGMHIGVVLVDAMPLSVDTPEDLERVKSFLNQL